MISKVISGGQTGADQAGLRAAKAVGLATGGWVPKGCRTDDGPAPWLVTDYGCQAHTSRQYAPRTIANVREADCLIWFGSQASPGGVLTLRTVADDGLPYCCVPFPPTGAIGDFVEIVRLWLGGCTDADVLMIAGNRESTNPGIGVFVEVVLREALRYAAIR